VTPPSQKKPRPTEATAPPHGERAPSRIEKDAIDAELSGLTYEQARDALLDVVRRLESGAETLEESLALWERGEALARRCEQWLAGAQARLEAADQG
jgi:exodeoxyribonuclease VII small subunit